MEKVLAEMAISESQRKSSPVRHYRNSNYVSDQIARIKVVQFDEDSGYYIVYFDQEGNELNDTFFDTTELLKKNIKFEFGVEIILSE